MRTTSLPFPLGQTYFKGETVDVSAYEYVGYIGQEYWVKDPSVTDDRMSLVRVVRNSTGGDVSADDKLTLNAEGSRATAVAGAGTYPDDPAADPNLTNDIPDGDLFYAYIEGPGPS